MSLREMPGAELFKQFERHLAIVAGAETFPDPITFQPGDDLQQSRELLPGLREEVRHRLSFKPQWG